MDKMKFSELLTSYLDLRDSTKDEDDWTPIHRSSSRREQMNDLLQEMDTMIENATVSKDVKDVKSE